MSKVNNNLLILGAGQYGAVASEIADSMGCFDRIDFLDDNAPEHAVGFFNDCQYLLTSYSYATVAIGNPELRALWLDRLREYGYKIPVLIHSQAYVSPAATIGEGTIVEPNATIQAHVRVGNACLICSGSVLKHNCEVGDVCYIDCNSTVMPETCVPSGTRVNANSVYFFRK